MRDGQASRSVGRAAAHSLHFVVACQHASEGTRNCGGHGRWINVISDDRSAAARELKSVCKHFICAFREGAERAMHAMSSVGMHMFHCLSGPTGCPQASRQSVEIIKMLPVLRLTASGYT